MDHSLCLDAPVLVADRISPRLRRSEDLYEALGCVLGIALVILLGIYANSTTTGVTQDVRVIFGSFLRQVLLLPFSVLEGFFVVVAPVTIIIALARRGSYQPIFEMVFTGTAAAIIGQALSSSVPYLPTPLVASLLVVTPSGQVISLDVVMVVLAAAFTAAGDGRQMKSIRYGWWGIWLVLALGVIRGTVTVPGLVVTLLLGRLIGCSERWLLGFDDNRAGPTQLAEALLNVGVSPVSIVRVDLPTATQPLDVWRVHETEKQTDYATGRVDPTLVAEPAVTEPETHQISAQSTTFADRHYQVWDQQGHCYDLHILDPDRAITGTLGELWNGLRLRGISRWISPALKANAERAVLNAMTAARAGVATPPPEGIAEAGDSIAVVWKAPPPLAPLRDVVAAGREEALLDQAWLQLIDAHSRGISHRNLDLGSLAVDQPGNLWILNWDQGEVATSELNRNIDRAQMLAHLALITDVDVALASARKYFSADDLASTAMVLQSAILPPLVRAGLKKTGILEQLRDQMTAEMPAEQMRPVKLQRFSPRTVIMAAILVIAVVAVFGSLNFDAVVAAVRDANPLWMLWAFLVASTAWVGAAVPLVAFSPKKISLWNATLAQMAASITTVVAPAGIGPAALNLRFLTKQKLTMPVAVATVTLVQISQFLTSVALLLVVAVVTGTSLNIAIPTMTIVWVAAAVAAIVTAVLAIPKIREWLWGKLQPYWEQIYPQLLWVVAHPKELGIAFAGNLMTSLAYMGAFAASLYAFGYTLSPMSLVMTYLISSTLGSVVPSPGGIGPVEVALTGGLTAAGIPPAVAVSTAVLFRLVSFYGRIPFGWLAMHLMERKKLI